MDEKHGVPRESASANRVARKEPLGSGGESSSALRLPFTGVLVASGEPGGLGRVAARVIDAGRRADLRVTGVGDEGMCRWACARGGP
jgi:hypothetical protein